MNHQLSYLTIDHQNLSLSIKEQIFSSRDGKKIRLIYENTKFDEDQIKSIIRLKQYALSKGKSLNDVPDKTILRYLYSFQFDHKEALEKLNIYLQWYQDPNIQKEDSTTLQIINQGVIYTYGRDKFLRPIVYLNVALMEMNKYTLNDYLAAINKIVTLVIDKLFIKGKLQNYLFVIDTGNKGISSLPLSTVKEMVLKLSYVYSLRMGKLLVINANTMIRLMYSAVSPFLSDMTKEKIKILSQSDVSKSKMKQFIDQNQLQQKYNGNLQNLMQKWPPRIAGKNKSFQNQNKKYQNMKEKQVAYGKQQIYGQMRQLGMQTENDKLFCCSGANCVIF